jgi:hypothetical protein
MSPGWDEATTYFEILGGPVGRRALRSLKDGS